MPRRQGKSHTAARWDASRPPSTRARLRTMSVTGRSTPHVPITRDALRNTANPAAQGRFVLVDARDDETTFLSRSSAQAFRPRGYFPLAQNRILRFPAQNNL